MASVKDHYDAHLGKFYSWMLGNFEERVQQQASYFRLLQLDPSRNKVAFDLGCGNGIQSVALADLGYQVIAVDFNTQLLNELRTNAAGKAVTIVEADLSDTNQYLQTAELMVCMGDTITHFESIAQIETVLNEWYHSLVPGGRLLISFRDLSVEPEPEKRFIPVRSDENRILTCFLEYHHEHVMVHDLLYENLNGQWNFSVSTYKKLRLSRNQVAGFLVKCGFRVRDGRTIDGMLYISADK
ncbi:MAG TPA: class I SAM-dependent methyltransferase [Chitinophagaceae bacterium]